MQVCGRLEQRAPGNFTFVDNLKRDYANFSVLLLHADDSRYITVEKIHNYTYQFIVESNKRGINIVQILANGQHFLPSVICYVCTLEHN